jgi:hypothetical protein
MLYLAALIGPLAANPMKSDLLPCYGLSKAPQANPSNCLT